MTDGPGTGPDASANVLSVSDCLLLNKGTRQLPLSIMDETLLTVCKSRGAGRDKKQRGTGPERPHRAEWWKMCTDLPLSSVRCSLG